MSTDHHNPLTGISVRHQTRCASRHGDPCDCSPSFRGELHHGLARIPLKGPSFKTIAEAQAWHTEARQKLRRNVKAFLVHDGSGWRTELGRRLSSRESPEAPVDAAEASQEGV